MLGALFLVLSFVDIDPADCAVNHTWQQKFVSGTLAENLQACNDYRASVDVDCFCQNCTTYTNGDVTVICATCNIGTECEARDRRCLGNWVALDCQCLSEPYGAP